MNWIKQCEEQEEIKKLFEMKLHQSIRGDANTDPSFSIMRVAGGWISTK